MSPVYRAAVAKIFTSSILHWMDYMTPWLTKRGIHLCSGCFIGYSILRDGSDSTYVSSTMKLVFGEITNRNMDHSG